MSNLETSIYPNTCHKIFNCFCSKPNRNTFPTNAQSGKPKKRLDFSYKHSCFAMFTASFPKMFSLYYHLQSALGLSDIIQL